MITLRTRISLLMKINQRKIWNLRNGRHMGVSPSAFSSLCGGLVRGDLPHFLHKFILLCEPVKKVSGKLLNSVFPSKKTIPHLAR